MTIDTLLNEDTKIYYPWKNEDGIYEAVEYSLVDALKGFHKGEDLVRFIQECRLKKHECAETCDILNYLSEDKTRTYDFISPDNKVPETEKEPVRFEPLADKIFRSYSQALEDMLNDVNETTCQYTELTYHGVSGDVTIKVNQPNTE